MLLARQSPEVHNFEKCMCTLDEITIDINGRSLLATSETSVGMANGRLLVTLQTYPTGQSTIINSMTRPNEVCESDI
jgi:hypothetical protein